MNTWRRIPAIGARFALLMATVLLIYALRPVDQPKEPPVFLAADVAPPGTAQTFTTLHSFCAQINCPDGANPIAPLIQATNGDLYGTTESGGHQWGTVFKITPSGTLTTVYTFCSSGVCTDGGMPGGVVQATNGYLYGTTSQGGASYISPNNCAPEGCGTVFKMTPGGKLTTIYNFCPQGLPCTDGGGPNGGLIQATNGDFYGTTSYGGTNCVPVTGDCGTVFRITPSGALTTIYNFCSQTNCADGEFPYAGLVQATNGDFYGTTGWGGANGDGTVFKITPSGMLTTLYSFCSHAGCTDGANPFAGLVQATNGDLYGATGAGGIGASVCAPGQLTPVGGCGTLFKITPSGTLATLYSFCSQGECTDGMYPLAALIQGTDGYLYGTTSGGGANGEGTIFKITPSGKLTALYSLCSQSGCSDGASPQAALIQATNGDLYGTTMSGGAATYYGTVFSLSIGLGPFVEAQTTSGRVGAAVKILGTDLTGATSVTFNGTAATFTVVSPSLITTTVPTGATTGKVEVVTPGGTLSSNLVFRVL
jgi:uncharacterized repeat protein (TIGR03803 family)